jgi:hypothetical protein
MTWTVACFCGNTYAAPPDRCDVCGATVEGDAVEDPARHRIQNGADLYSLAARRAPLPVARIGRSQHGGLDGSPGR